MNLVVVFLTKVRVHIIVPERYVHGLSIKSVKNLGKNSCRDYLIYWSDECIEGENYPEPNLNAKESSTFPTAQGGAWYHGRLIYFTGKQ